jgi:hypothetical protein
MKIKILKFYQEKIAGQSLSRLVGGCPTRQQRRSLSYAACQQRRKKKFSAQHWYEQYMP